MQTKNALMIAGVALGGYLLYKSLQKPTSTEETVTKFNSMGANAYLSPSGIKDKTGSPSAFVQYNVSLADNSVATYKFNTGDWDKLNLAQKTLLALRVPADWVLG